MTRTTVRGGLWLLAAMAMGCVGNSPKSHRADAGGWTTVPPAHDAGASDHTGADGRTSRDAKPDAPPRDAVADAKPATGRDAAPDAKPAGDAGADAKMGHDARPDGALRAGTGGVSCSVNAECASGFCVDGVCCNTACRGACVSCGLPLSVGTCVPAPIGRPDPHGTCTDQGPTSCGQIGTCDGTGNCALYPSETVCGRPFCTGNVWTTYATCDGAGTCVPGLSFNCFPYVCVDATCQTSCAGPADCATGQVCMAGTCGNGRVEGTACTGDPDCNSGICSQGVCCASRCDGVCNSCALSDSLGTCQPVPASQQPDGSVCP
jgi:hypothetical protein